MKMWKEMIMSSPEITNFVIIELLAHVSEFLQFWPVYTPYLDTFHPVILVYTVCITIHSCFLFVLKNVKQLWRNLDVMTLSFLHLSDDLDFRHANPVDTGRKLNVNKTSRTYPERLMFVQFMSCVYGERTSGTFVKMGRAENELVIYKTVHKYISKQTVWNLPEYYVCFPAL